MVRGTFLPARGLSAVYHNRGARLAFVTVTPVFDTISDVGAASHRLLPNGNIQCTINYDSSVRFHWKLTTLRGSVPYRLSYTIISIAGGSPVPPTGDWCDGADGPVPASPERPWPLSVGPQTVIVSRPIYMPPYDFFDISNGEDEDGESGYSVVVEMTMPVLEVL